MTKDTPAAADATLRFARNDAISDANPDATLSATFSATADAAGLRSYRHSTTMATREGDPSTVSYTESAALPTVRSGSLAFDALFANAVHEMRQNSVSAIQDGIYNGGKPIGCECFETGEKWHYVWTRDLSYAAHLGLALLDPQRVRNSLEFKLSGYRPGTPATVLAAGEGDGLQILQDTGSGGSWPVSSDRVSWAFGADAALRALPAAERAAFAPTALRALVNTVENDRVAAFDTQDGLYTGEQSFLDWREQTYADWVANDLAHMASAKALSTNVAHYKAITLAARLAAEQGRPALAGKYGDWAAQLKAAINKRFWLPEAGLYSSLTGPHFDGAALHKFDWLGLSLAITTGVADAAQTARILASYPHGPVGAPVIYPQQPGMPIYHNRAIWPFVTAYGLDAAVAGRNVSVADEAYATLMRGAALHASNMENMEWLSGAPIVRHPGQAALDGPVINSRRQLWSVGAYLGMVVRNVFGVDVTDDGVRVAPFITTRLRREAFGGSGRIELRGLRLRGKVLDVNIALPPAREGEADGYYGIELMKLDGRLGGPSFSWKQLEEATGANNGTSVIDIVLGPVRAGEQGIKRVAGQPRETSGATFAPFDPVIAGWSRDAQGQVQLTIADPRNPAGEVSYNVYRNGALAAEGVAAGVWRDTGGAARAACYAVEAVSRASGNRSHHSAPRCVGEALEVAVGDARLRSSVAASAPDGMHKSAYLKNWGAAADQLTVDGLRVATAGRYAVQLNYRNLSYPINTGVTNAVKRLVLRDANGKIVAERIIQLPHTPPDTAQAPVYSTPAIAWLEPGVYRAELGDHFNMSHLQSNSVYGGAGGAQPVNRADIGGLRMLALD
ncbi:MGH1-like glycoside hydrolase domain-containing protein [Pseudoduganella namucuonensis]|uniref:Mannosylglycerate hydrolase MGH1-like glycoside hydrolase domain-containing protein n=1 Tax=Pseudoduganella namucuonensis TaxID=1035707 RepID=A0A1I7IZ72_9BURK|nr:esterase [Pseudoduganella namucuonensis]SFU78184.1 hypothetical protein SAMN05216552_1009177 [Pseudoduganella namucuonensis]